MMLSHKDEFRARASEARVQAGQTPLANVRETLLRSADAWELMAQREERVVAARDARARDKLAAEAAVQPDETVS